MINKFIKRKANSPVKPTDLHIYDEGEVYTQLTVGQEDQSLIIGQTEAKFALGGCLHTLFEDQVIRTPEAIAVIQFIDSGEGEEKQLTYRELNQRANQVAHYLRALGVGPETLVGVCLERSLEMIVALLGVLKAGGAYVPLDPEYPLERLDFMVAHSQVAVLLTERHLLARLPETQADWVCLDSDWPTIAKYGTHNPSSPLTHENLAYVIYTSGSTGYPKGVMIEHRSLVNYVKAANVEYELGPDDRVLQFASISWDTSVEEIYSSLTTGATLVLRTPAMLDSPTTFWLKCREWGLTVLNLPTAYWHELTAKFSSDQTGQFPPTIRLVIIGGEKALPGRVAIWRQHVGQQIRLINTYGLTEATAVTTMCDLSALEETASGEVPIGRPIRNVQVYVLDENLQPVPDGQAGQLYIGGAGLARGYFKRPELTAESFIPNPFDQEPGARLYKTGDLVRYRPDGHLEYLGRFDHQVKVRGYRIELGEIETVLQQHPAVRDAVVIVREDEPDDKRLVAYLVLNQGMAPRLNDLRRFLHAKLPAYMWPAHFVTLEDMPLTPNGKVNRQALPAPNRLRPDLAATFIAPRTPTEKVVASIYADVLGLEQIGISDNFFELGGHSLLVTQVASRIVQAFAINLPVRTLFEIPTVAGLAERVEAICQTEPNSSTFGSLKPVAHSAELPLSFAQERLWFLDQLQPNASVYNIPLAGRLRGALNLTALEQCFNEIARRHEALRTTFPAIAGQPRQLITATQSITFSVVDLQTWPELEREAEVLRRVHEEVRRPFDLAKGPLWRVTLLRLGQAEHILLLTMHHIISDEWSLQVLFRELEILYPAFSRGAASPLPALPSQYADFSRWQRQWLQGEVLEAQLRYWRQQLADCPRLLELPTDRPRPAKQSLRGATQTRLLPQALGDALKTFSQHEEVTLFMSLLAAFQTLLYRYSGQTDIPVGSPIANRSLPEVEDLIGFFVNTLVLRTNLSGNPSFRELVHRVREVALDAYTHQDLPFELLVKALKPERNLSHNPLFQVMFAFQSYSSMSALRLTGLSVTPLEVDNGAAGFDLTLFVEDTDDGLKIIVEYNSDLFDTATMTRLLGHFQTLLEGVVANPEQRLDELPLLTASERQQLLVEWNNTQIDYPHNICFHQLFEAQVERTPEAIAIVFEQQQLTYRELNHRANQLAHHLRALGVGPEVLVGLSVERTVEMMVGLLGILKAGGAYVPLDPGYPQERLAFMIEDAQVMILLTQQHLALTLPQNQAQIICLDTDWETIAQEAEENPVNQTTSENLAYVLYTSGSTGQPKGVLIPHRGLVNYLTWCSRAYPLEAGKGALVHSSISFDLTITGLFGPLLVGRTVYLLPQGPEVEVLSAALQAGDNYSLIKLTPTHLELLSQQLMAAEAVGQTQAFVIGGENLVAEQIAFWQEAAPETILINEYGPTETVVGCCVYQVPLGHYQSGSIPIGRPIANTELYVLDSHLQPVPIGVTGELYIGGVGLARGYLNRPELTAEKFISHPFSSKPGDKLYKTGDRVCYLADGNLKFLGRLDHQVKVRGYRIEPGEIEAALRQHPAVRDALVIVREDKPGDKRLVAYMIFKSDDRPGTRELRHFIQTKLPPYMIPSAFISLDTWPLTVNGKVDRQALPEPGQLYTESRGASYAPQDTLELQLTRLWEQALNVRPIGTRDNFFELGGYSLLAVRLFARIEQVFGQKLAVATLFQAPTVEQLATLLRQGGLTSAQSSVVAIQPAGSKPPFFCMHGMGGGVLDYTELARCLGQDQPFYGLQERGLNGLHEPFTQIETMAAHYVEEIRILQPEGPYFLGGYCFGGTIAFEVARQLQAQGHQVGLVAIIDNTAPNSDYDQSILQPSTVIKFIRNLSYWLSDFLQLSPNQMLARLNRKAKWVKQRIINVFDPPTISHSWADIEEIIDEDFSQIPEEYHKFLSAHYMALINYRPQVYPGQVTLFRTRRESLFGPFDPEMGWGRLAAEGVKIKEISGFHAALLQQPHVQSLANQLKECLNKAQANQSNRKL